MYASMVYVLNPNVLMLASKNTLKFKQDKNISYPVPVIRFLIGNKEPSNMDIHDTYHVQYHMQGT